MSLRSTKLAMGGPPRQFLQTALSTSLTSTSIRPPAFATSDQSPMPPRNLLPTIFSSLPRITTSTTTPTRWTLLRTLKSENINDIQGDLHGTATFTPLRSTTTPPRTIDPNHQNNEGEADAEGYTDLLYSEEGSLPPSFGPGIRWTKKYIWRLSANGRISVWFVKIDSKEGEKEEADYLFHEFDLASAGPATPDPTAEGSGDSEFVTPPVPPEAGSGTKIVAARGNHLCIQDMYRTAYSFRVSEGSGEVLSWASRHVVRGPKKEQDIVNFYFKDL